MIFSVGGGSAGAVIALRLSENKNVTVLLIEAGVTTPDILNIPILGPLKHTSDLDWRYKTVPQVHSCFGLKDNSSIWPSGKVLGGSTHLNYMIYLKGNEHDFSSWKDPASNEWNTEDINYYFQKVENCVLDNEYGTRHCNNKGSLTVREAAFTTEFSDAILGAAKELGYDVTNLNSLRGDGFMKPQVNILGDGRRWTSDRKLRDVLPGRRNLKLLTNAVAERVLLADGFEAFGVECRMRGGMRRFHAREEVVLSAGTVGSARILMLSGIGPRDVLLKAKVEPKVDLPVGKNLQDHITTGLDLVILNKTLFSVTDLTSPKSVYEYFMHGKGPFTSAMVEAIGVMYSEPVNPGQCSPDLEFMVMMAGASSDGGLFSRYSLGISDKIWDEYFALLKEGTAVSILPVLLHPKSVGEVVLNPEDPTGPPLINPRYLSDGEDTHTLIRGIRIVQKLTNTEAMKNFGARFNELPLPGCEAFDFDSDQYWKCYVQHLTLTSYHPVGTCKMGIFGPGGESVVDHRLRVHGTNKLRVMDASIMPTLPSANTNAAVVMIAEKGADLIKEDYYRRRSTSQLRRHFLRDEKKCQLPK